MERLMRAGSFCRENRAHSCPTRSSDRPNVVLSLRRTAHRAHLDRRRGRAEPLACPCRFHMRTVVAVVGCRPRRSVYGERPASTCAGSARAGAGPRRSFYLHRARARCCRAIGTRQIDGTAVQPLALGLPKCQRRINNWPVCARECETPGL